MGRFKSKKNKASLNSKFETNWKNVIDNFSKESYEFQNANNASSSSSSSSSSSTNNAAMLSNNLVPNSFPTPIVGNKAIAQDDHRVVESILNDLTCSVELKYKQENLLTQFDKLDNATRLQISKLEFPRPHYNLLGLENNVDMSKSKSSQNVIESTVELSNYTGQFAELKSNCDDSYNDATLYSKKLNDYSFQRIKAKTSEEQELETKINSSRMEWYSQLPDIHKELKQAENEVIEAKRIEIQARKALTLALKSSYFASNQLSSVQTKYNRLNKSSNKAVNELELQRIKLSDEADFALRSFNYSSELLSFVEFIEKYTHNKLIYNDERMSQEFSVLNGVIDSNISAIKSLKSKKTTNYFQIYKHYGSLNILHEYFNKLYSHDSPLISQENQHTAIIQQIKSKFDTLFKHFKHFNSQYLTQRKQHQKDSDKIVNKTTILWHSGVLKHKGPHDHFEQPERVGLIIQTLENYLGKLADSQMDTTALPSTDIQQFKIQARVVVADRSFELFKAVSDIEYNAINMPSLTVWLDENHQHDPANPQHQLIRSFLSRAIVKHAQQLSRTQNAQQLPYSIVNLDTVYPSTKTVSNPIAPTTSLVLLVHSSTYVNRVLNTSRNVNSLGFKKERSKYVYFLHGGCDWSKAELLEPAAADAIHTETLLPLTDTPTDSYFTPDYDALDFDNVGSLLIGCPIRIWSISSNRWHRARVQSFSFATSRHKVLYEDATVSVSVNLGSDRNPWEIVLPQPGSKSGESWYTSTRQDSVTSICVQHQVNVKEFIRLNQLLHPNALRHLRQSDALDCCLPLKLPSATSYSLPSLAELRAAQPKPGTVPNPEGATSSTNTKSKSYDVNLVKDAVEGFGLNLSMGQPSVTTFDCLFCENGNYDGVEHECGKQVISPRDTVTHVGGQRIYATHEVYELLNYVPPYSRVKLTFEKPARSPDSLCEFCSSVNDEEATEMQLTEDKTVMVCDSDTCQKEFREMADDIETYSTSFMLGSDSENGPDDGKSGGKSKRLQSYSPGQYSVDEDRKRVRKLISKFALSQAFVAQSIGIKKDNVNHWLRGSLVHRSFNKETSAALLKWYEAHKNDVVYTKTVDEMEVLETSSPKSPVKTKKVKKASKSRNKGNSFNSSSSVNNALISYNALPKQELSREEKLQLITNMKELRDKCGWSQKVISRQIGIGQSMLSEFLNQKYSGGLDLDSIIFNWFTNNQSQIEAQSLKHSNKMSKRFQDQSAHLKLESDIDFKTLEDVGALAVGASVLVKIDPNFDSNIDNLSTSKRSANRRSAILGKGNRDGDLDFNEHIRYLMAKKELTQKILAQKTGLPQSVLSEWINAKYCGSTDVRIYLHNYFSQMWPNEYNYRLANGAEAAAAGQQQASPLAASSSTPNAAAEELTSTAEVKRSNGSDDNDVAMAEAPPLETPQTLPLKVTAVEQQPPPSVDSSPAKSSVVDATALELSEEQLRAQNVARLQALTREPKVVGNDLEFVVSLLKHALMKFSLSQKHVALACGISQPALCQWISKKYTGGIDITSHVINWLQLPESEQALAKERALKAMKEAAAAAAAAAAATAAATEVESVAEKVEEAEEAEPSTTTSNRSTGRLRRRVKKKERFVEQELDDKPVAPSEPLMGTDDRSTVLRRLLLRTMTKKNMTQKDVCDYITGSQSTLSLWIRQKYVGVQDVASDIEQWLINIKELKPDADYADLVQKVVVKKRKYKKRHTNDSNKKVKTEGSPAKPKHKFIAMHQRLKDTSTEDNDTSDDEEESELNSDERDHVISHYMYEDDNETVCSDAKPSKRSLGNNPNPAPLFKPSRQAIIDEIDHLSKQDLDTYINKHTYNAALQAAGVVCKAVDLVFFNTLQADKSKREAGAVPGEAVQTNVFCVVRPPGHHAGRHGLTECCTSHGFCLLNNVAIGLQYARMHYNLVRMAIIDIDVHYGNGTHEIFLEDPDTFFCSVHMAYRSKHSPPPVDGKAGEEFFGSDLPHAEEQTANSLTIKILPEREAGEEAVDADGHELVGSAGFRQSFTQHIIPALTAFDPELIFISAGFDGHFNDPIGGSLGLKEADYSYITKQLVDFSNDPRLSCRGKIISVLEGGYDTETSLAPSALAHVLALSNTDSTLSLSKDALGESVQPEAAADVDVVTSAASPAAEPEAAAVMMDVS